MASGQRSRTSPATAVSGTAAAKAADGVAGGTTARAARLRLPDWTVVVPIVATLAMMLWGLTAPSYWRDESATLAADSRTIPQLWHLLGNVDAVHGLYYFLLWPIVHLWGTREFETRLPSAIAMAAAAGGIAVLGRRLRSRRAGLYAGLIFAVLPMVTIRGHDARPFAFETAAAVLCTYLLVRAAQDPRPRRFVGYGLSVALLGYLNLFGLTLVAAHAIVLVLVSRLPAARAEQAGTQAAASEAAASRPPLSTPRLITRWLISVAAAGIVLIPLIRAGWLERGGLSWLAKPTWGSIPPLAIQLAGTSAMLAVIGALTIIGAARSDWPGTFPRPARRSPGDRPAWARWAGRNERVLTALAVAWLVLPPALLMIASLLVSPIYQIMYVAFTLPAVALLAGAGLASIGQPARIAVFAVVATLSVPTQLALRQPTAGGSLRASSNILAKHERPGDAVYYVGAVPAWNVTYPAGFGHLRDISSGESPGQAGRLVGVEPPVAVMQQRLNSVQRLWIIQMGKWQQPAITLMPDFRLAEKLHTGDMQMRLYVRIKPASS